MKLNKRLRKLALKIDNLESEVKSIKKIVKNPSNQPVIVNIQSSTISPRRKCRLRNFYCAPDKAADGRSTVNALVKTFGINQNGIMTFKTDYISTRFATQYNGKELSLSVAADHIILHINKMKVRAWSISRVLRKLNDKNTDFCIGKCQLKQMIENGDIKLKFNVSTIKDHGTYWKINPDYDNQ